uniref:Uncharacterized protein n=1 Tax=Opuntia streptacantha TaxID=393608 RepID=A0A7C9DV00_OPUST
MTSSLKKKKFFLPGHYHSEKETASEIRSLAQEESLQHTYWFQGQALQGCSRPIYLMESPLQTAYFRRDPTKETVILVDKASLERLNFPHMEREWQQDWKHAGLVLSLCCAYGHR